MTACALPRFMFTWVPSGNVRLTPESMSQDSDRGAGLSVAIGRNRLPESSDKGGIGSPMPSCRQSRRRFLASFTDSPLFSIHRFILPCLTLHLFRKEVRVAVGLWDSSFKNAFHTLSYRFAAVILVILYSRGKGKELKDAEQGCIADTLTPAKRSRIHLLQQKPAAGETPALGHGRLHAISETSGKRDLRDTLFQYWQEGMRNTLQDPVRHTERNIVEINKISQETEHRWFRARKLLIISIIFDKNR